ncbi:hypothetical protein [Streptomyces malaysiense]|uniref:hypothetical protein n=1 Tax=Streptomyces malaysiense TaxID=1428626 RepID=UPI000B0F344B|nr:hypothetical protein [Streptomyces malaysiense]
MAVGAVAVALLSVPGAGTAVAARGAGVRYCGADPASGLGVLAGGRVSCGVALKVAAAYTKVWHGSPAGAEVRAAGARWKCGERRGDPDPYQACVEVRDSGRMVTLSS